jgi:hypothetical protein
MKKRKAHRHFEALELIAFWQLLAFTILLLLIWVNEILDLRALWFDLPARPPDIFEGCVLSIATIVAAVVAVGQTYEQQKRIISGLLTVCAQCRKIRVQSESWAHMDDYIADHSLALVTHGLCPECFTAMQTAVSALNPPRADAKPSA